jgi:hypothetical protein
MKSQRTQSFNLRFVVTRRVALILSHLVVGSGSLFAGSITPQSETVYLGESNVVSPPGGIASAPTQSDQNTCRAEQLSQTYLVLTGVALGQSTVTVVANDSTANVTVYRVSVKRNPDVYRSLEASIAQFYPRSNIKLIIVPASDKVIVHGTVTSYHMLQQIIALIESKSLQRSQIVQQVSIWQDCCCRRSFR